MAEPNKWFSIMEKEVMLKDKRPHVHMVHFLQTESVLSNDLGMTRCIMNTTKFKHSIKSKRQFCCWGRKWSKAFDVQKKGGMFMYYRNLLRSDGLSYSKGKLRKVDQTTILANGFKPPEPTLLLLTENFYMPQTVGKRIRFQPLEF
jgi:hypothetical protein